MANFSYTASKSFTPFTFEEMLKPMAMYTLEYNAVQEGLSELGTKANVFNNLANSTSDPIASSMYKKYSLDLYNQAETLANEGLSLINRKNLLDMRSRYAKEITPIELAFTRRRELNNKWMDMMSKDNTLMFQRNPNDPYLGSLDRFILDPEYNYGTPISGALITKRVADELLNYKTTMLRNGDWESTAFGLLLLRRKSTGLTREDIVNILQNPESFPEIKQLIDNVVASTGILDWNNQDAVDNAYRYAYEALSAGLGKLDMEVLKDQSYMTPYEQWLMEKLKKENAILDAKLGKLNGNSVEDNANLIFKWIGNEVKANEVDPELNSLSRNFDAYTQAIANEETIKPMKEPVYSVPDPLTGRVTVAYYKDVEDPKLTAYNTLSKKYNTTDLDLIRKSLDIDIRKKLTLNRGALLNRGQSKLLMQDLRSALLAGIDDWEDSDEVKKRIHNTSDGDAPSKEDLEKIFDDETADLIYYPASNEFKISTKSGNYIIDNNSAFGNIMTNSPLGAMPLDLYLEFLSLAYLESDGSDEYTTKFNKYLNLGMASMNEYYNMINPEATSTSSKATIWNDGTSKED